MGGGIRTQNEAGSPPTVGQVIISLFDGEPYTLWNIRDLARHSGFKVVTSWRFPWKAYPEYRHARTLGNIRSKTDGAEVTGIDRSKKGGSWKGEEREARGFVLEMVDQEHERVGLTVDKKTKQRGRTLERPRNKRKRSSSTSGSDA